MRAPIPYTSRKPNDGSFSDHTSSHWTTLGVAHLRWWLFCSDSWQLLVFLLENKNGIFLNVLLPGTMLKLRFIFTYYICQAKLMPPLGSLRTSFTPSYHWIVYRFVSQTSLRALEAQPTGERFPCYARSGKYMEHFRRTLTEQWAFLSVRTQRKA